MIHLTLNTGHWREAPRSEVSDDVLAPLRSLIASGGGPIPGPRRGYVVQIWRMGRDALFTVARGDDDYPVVTCGLCVDEPARVWERLLVLTPMAVVLRTECVAMPATLPWLAVVIQDFSAGEDLGWLADFERCLAWALIETETDEDRSG